MFDHIIMKQLIFLLVYFFVLHIIKKIYKQQDIKRLMHKKDNSKYSFNQVFYGWTLIFLVLIAIFDGFFYSFGLISMFNSNKVPYDLISTNLYGFIIYFILLVIITTIYQEKEFKKNLSNLRLQVSYIRVLYTYTIVFFVILACINFYIFSEITVEHIPSQTINSTFLKFEKINSTKDAYVYSHKTDIYNNDEYHSSIIYPDQSYFKQVLFTSDNNYIGVNNDLIKFDSKGNIIWVIKQSQMKASIYKVIEHNHDYYLLLGNYLGSYTSYSIVKVSSSGEIVYTNPISTDGEPLTFFSTHEDKLIFITHYTQEIIYSIYDEDAQHIRTKRTNIKNGGYNFVSAEIQENGNVYIVGNGTRSFILSFDFKGNLAWDKYFSSYIENDSVINFQDLLIINDKKLMAIGYIYDKNTKSYSTVFIEFNNNGSHFKKDVLNTSFAYLKDSIFSANSLKLASTETNELYICESQPWLVKPLSYIANNYFLTLSTLTLTILIHLHQTTPTRRQQIIDKFKK